MEGRQVIIKVLQGEQAFKDELIRNVFLVSSIIPKNERKNSTTMVPFKSNCFRSFFGRIEDTKKTFRNY